ncbi:MAG: FKBP-type peptidyl-prolyl cis-trans isomerase [Pseudomonadota bacterium]|nr:FKBP-type peptidyl-prolyl cis-trans isomerase [Pseudomonadota bacterium]MED5275187.1 FKBP-type peptidyl-prolyl cis-trans isomerase [Pseudomonadota bacterium]MED5430379.1 FKBP-type peptidyl-prolyl cis-trans isomerase [Pseudomonadota bacterium]|tara:strand:- start:3 stop:443 length:441 start_codon:yes stop_codon:yes gene_type:complete
MNIIKFGSTIEMHYSISNLDGIKFESTFDKKPIVFTIGDGLIPQKLEVPLYGLSEEEEQTIQLEAKDAFGLRDENKVKTIKRKVFPQEKMIKIGNVLEFDIKTKAGKENSTFGMIKNIKGEDVLVDLNHPLAGQSILLRVKILKVK